MPVRTHSGRPRLWSCAALWLFLAIALPAQAPGDPLAIMSFNIRYGTARDGENHWTARRDLVFDVIHTEDADIVGLQEALDFQIDEILGAAPRYAAVGVGRDDGKRAGEHAAILFRKDRFRVGASGTFWFSDSPSVPGSRSWGNRVTRICTWARFIDRDGRAFWVYNVHLDHESQPSRERSAALLRTRIAERVPATEPVVVTGDFNVGEDNAALATMVEAGFVDTFRVLHARAANAGTFNGFAGRDTGEKIDYVLVERGTAVVDAAIVRASRNGRYPSDHFPVTAKVRLK